ncbi:hypothetical protein HYT02_03270 [Candidatus Gottesmanbacteria bacterium]|nr:hypothetical protein [Candidatus Gottesmanbacteria bacterium]
MKKEAPIWVDMSAVDIGAEPEIHDGMYVTSFALGGVCGSIKAPEKIEPQSQPLMPLFVAKSK